jgi:hypothetical protein
MHSSPNHEPWQIGPVSSSGRVAAAALAIVAVDSVFTWSVTPYLIEAVALTAVPVVVAIRVFRGFPRSSDMAFATFVAILAVAFVALSRLGLQAGQASAAIVVAIVVAATGLGSLALGWLRNRPDRDPTIGVPRWPSAPVALRSPSRYQTTRRYR